ncbi:carbohydrate kinase family protein [Candidatus Peregrinibacteria bacterium]|nr:carbohydrate kinase family protein [Candidatus Peregrinibacteria bacterium]
MSHTVSIGGLTYDLFVDVDHEVAEGRDGTHMFQLQLGSKIPVRRVVSGCGGGAANTAVGLSRLGCSAACAGVVGSDQWGGMMLKNLETENVSTKGITVVEHETSSFSIVLLAQSERVILNEPGTNAHLHDVTFDRSQAAAADWVYLNHIHKASCAIEDDILKMLTDTRPPHLTWNPGGCQIDRGIREKNNALLVARTELLIVNREEAIAFTGKKTTEEALRVMIAAGTRIACVTDGKNGSFATDGTQIHFCPCLPAKVMDTTGAGDAFGTAMTWALVRGKDLPTALRAGTINGASVVSVIGAQPGLLTETQIQSAIDKSALTVESKSF